MPSLLHFVDAFEGREFVLCFLILLGSFSTQSSGLFVAGNACASSPDYLILVLSKKGLLHIFEFIESLQIGLEALRA
jgi:hypothetical protein